MTKPKADLLQGKLDMLILKALSLGPLHGYGVIQRIRQLSDELLEAEEQAEALGLSYSTVCRWLRKFREEGMPGLFPATQYPREPQTPEHVIMALLFYKTCAPRASDRELARVLRGHPSPHP